MARRDLLPGQRTLRKVPPSFYLQDTRCVAKRLLGKYLVRSIGDELLVGRIVEVEAYLGERDPASHAYKGRTRRNEVMFREGGRLYVYFTYGMHFCANVVTGREGVGRAVLIRALEPVGGIGTMAHNRRISPFDLTNLCSGPAKLCQALRIGRKENGTYLCGDAIWIAEETGRQRRFSIGRSTRVGIRNGREHLWRYFIKDSPHLSPGKPGRS